MDNIETLMEKLGYEFKNKNLLIEALTHRSYANEHTKETKKRDYEKLEFLGDSVLNLITTEYIVYNYKGLTEGQLSKIKSQIISKEVFATISKELNLGEYMLLSNGENATGGRKRKSLLEDAFESVIGAIFVDSNNYYTTKKIALKFLKNKIEHIDEYDEVLDYKTMLQEYVQSKHKTVPEYVLIAAIGPDHNKVFKTSVYINGDIHGIGVAKSKKEAEKKAAKEALEKLGELK